VTASGNCPGVSKAIMIVGQVNFSRQLITAAAAATAVDDDDDDVVVLQCDGHNRQFPTRQL